jgi:uncharacterized membrane protein
MKDNWGRYRIYSTILLVLLAIGIFLDVINKHILGSVIPQDITLGLSCLLVGPYLGFQLCNYEVTRVYKLNKKQEKDSMNTTEASKNKEV